MITLVDTGINGCELQIFEYIQSTGRDPSEIALIVLTHSHPDHIGAARAIQQATGCSIAANPGERAWIEDIDLQNRERPVPGFTMLVGGPVQVDHELIDGEIIEPDETRAGEMLVFHTPGHSKGSISLFLHKEGALFSGDAVPVAGDLPVYDDAVASAKSVKRLRETTGIQYLLSSWDEPREGTPHTNRWIWRLSTSRKSTIRYLPLPQMGLLILWNLPKKPPLFSGFPLRQSPLYWPELFMQTSRQETGRTCFGILKIKCLISFSVRSVFICPHISQPGIKVKIKLCYPLHLILRADGYSFTIVSRLVLDVPVVFLTIDKAEISLVFCPVRIICEIITGDCMRRVFERFHGTSRFRITIPVIINRESGFCQGAIPCCIHQYPVATDLHAAGKVVCNRKSFGKFSKIWRVVEVRIVPRKCDCRIHYAYIQFPEHLSEQVVLGTAGSFTLGE